MSDPEFQYFFDPLCGWCYASAPALAGLVEAYGGRVEMMPVGLFAEPRPIATIAEHAWRNDRRIGELTGQRFTEAYHRNVLQAPGGIFTSAPLTTALVALGELDASLEQPFLSAAQSARYVDGRDTSRIDEVARVAEWVALRHGLAFDPPSFAVRLQHDEALRERAQKRMAYARGAMASLPGRGVPRLLVRLENASHTVDGELLYAGKDRLLAAIRRLGARN